MQNTNTSPNPIYKRYDDDVLVNDGQITRLYTATLDRIIRANGFDPNPKIIISVFNPELVEKSRNYRLVCSHASDIGSFQRHGGLLRFGSRICSAVF
jgi:hypothetical protein